MQDLAVIHDEETEKTTREVVNGANFREDSNVNMEEYLENVNEKSYGYTEEDSEFL